MWRKLLWRKLYFLTEDSGAKYPFLSRLSHFVLCVSTREGVGSHATRNDGVSILEVSCSFG